RRVAAHEGVVADVGLVLGGAVEVAGDGAGSYVYAFADDGIAEVRQMVGLRACPKARLLQFDEIADVRPGVDLIVHPEPRVSPDLGIFGDFGRSDDAERSHFHTIRQPGALNDGAGPDAALTSDFRVAEDLCKRLDDGIHADADLAVDGDCLRLLDG